MTEMQAAGTAPSTSRDADEVSLDDGRRLLDEAARRHLNMSGSEFISAWDHGGFAEPDSLRVQQVAALLPFAR